MFPAFDNCFSSKNKVQKSTLDLQKNKGAPSLACQDSLPYRLLLYIQGAKRTPVRLYMDLGHAAQA